MKAYSRSMPLALITAAFAVVGHAGTAVAGTIPYTTALVSTFNPSESKTPTVTHSAPASASSVSYSKSGDWGSVGGFASADLSTGQLKVQASNKPLTGYSPYMQSNAWFGDGFRTYQQGGSPFQWQPNDGARFTLDLTGSTVSASDSNLANLGYGQVGAFVLLSLYKPGTLDPSSKLVGGDNNIGYYLYLLGNPNQNLTYVDQDGHSHSMIPTAYYGGITQNIHITQNFQPGGDFDWTILMGISGQLSGPEYYNIDLSHTLTVGYSGPAGSTTQSVSGLFNNFAPVPEPSAMILLATALAGVAAQQGLRGRRAS